MVDGASKTFVPRNEKALPQWAGRRHRPISLTHPVVVASVVSVLALLRMLPARLEHEEPYAFWDVVPTMNPIAYLLEPWGGYLAWWARFAFLVAHPFGDAGPLVTRILAAAVIGALAGFLAFDVVRPAVSDDRVRMLAALALPLLPIPDPGPYAGPLNSQWWIAIFVLFLALIPPKRWHYPLIVAAGFVGLAPTLALPAFRDRRAFALLIPTAFQAAMLVTSPRRPVGVGISNEVLAISLTLVVVLAVARLPGRTRLAFAYLGLATLTLGSIMSGGYLQGRLLAAAGVGIVLGGLSIVIGLRHLAYVAIRR